MIEEEREQWIHTIEYPNVGCFTTAGFCFDDLFI